MWRSENSEEQPRASVRIASAKMSGVLNNNQTQRQLLNNILRNLSLII